MEEKNKYNQCLLNGYEFLDFENTKNTTLKEWYKVAINHKEDREIEKDVYENIKSKITNIYF
ncbi:hypothetical protein ACSSDJ_001591 [Campylobacter jejuni]